MRLTTEEKAMLNGDAGKDCAFGMRLLLEAGDAVKAQFLQPVTCAHLVEPLLVGGGQLGADFADHLLSLGSRVRIPTTLNTGSYDMAHPAVNRGDLATMEQARHVMRAYIDMGCQPTFTCSPQQEPQNQLRYGEHVAWGESNAVSYANSVFGARTNRYGNFICIAAALTGRVPATGFHLDENRRGEVVFRLGDIPNRVSSQTLFYHVLGYLVGRIVGERIPVIDGLNAAPTPHQLKAFGAAAASSGAVAMYHIIGVTPEAPTLDVALSGTPADQVIDVTLDDLMGVRQDLTSIDEGAAISAVCLGAPHLSEAELAEVARLLEEVTTGLDVKLYLAASRRTFEVAHDRGWLTIFANAGAELISDRCAYFPGILTADHGAVMTDSAKWAHYAPACINARVAIGSFRECIDSARRGRVVRRQEEWTL